MQEKEQKISPIKQRILKFAASLGCSKREFYSKIRVSRGTLESNTGITEDVMAKFIATYPEINPEWLLTGHGNMLKGDEIPENDEFNEEIETRPRIPLDASAGSLSIISAPLAEYECERMPLISRFPNYDFTIMVKGDSMEPEFHSGDEVACRLINEQSFIQWGRPHVLDTSQGVVLKRVYNRKDSILCRSDNKDYDDFEIPKEDIFRVALVVGSIRLY